MRPKVRADLEGHVQRSKILRTSACGKQLYTSKKLAKASAVTQRRVHGENVEVYHCYPCHGYHLGHVPGQPRRLAS